MAMQSPEILLSELNKALRRLRGACADMGNEEIDEKLLEVMRRLLLAEVLGSTWILAMGGSQGAGKTTLMANLYGLRGDGPNWLQSNEGRGEKMPVLIMEVEGLRAPQGYVRRLSPDEATKGFRLVDTQVDVAEFQQSICDPDAKDLLPVLQVPPRYFTRPNQAWLLLPGYEKQDRANRSWQELMRQAMIAAGGCIVVTDETRMANHQQLEIVKDMLQNELEGHKPCVVITKTEAHRNDPKRLADLRASAQATFQIEDELVESHIIFSGTDDADYMNEWMPRLRSAINNLNKGGQANRPAQLSNLSETLGKDLTRVLTTIRSKARLFFSSDRAGAGDGTQVLEEVLDTFDEAASELREAHRSKVEELTSKAYAAAAKALDSRLAENHEGFINWFSNAFDTTSGIKKKMQDLVQDSWQQATPTLFTNYADALTTLTLQKLGPMPESVNNNGGDVIENAASRTFLAPSGKLVRLGYMHASGQPVQFKHLNAEKASDIRILLGHSSQQEEQAHAAASKQLGQSVALIPAMTLEYTRLFYAMPEDSGLKAGATSLVGQSNTQSNIAVEGVESLKAGVDLGKTAIRSLAAVLAVDVVSDSDSDILGAIFGETAPADPGSTIPPISMPLTLHPAAVAATAVVAAAYLTTRAVSGLRSIEKAASAQAYSMLGTVHDHHVNHLRKQFDNSMAVSRSRIKERIRARYHMDETLMRKDRLAKAIADVMSITSDLRHELGSSASGLQLFITARSE